MPVRISRARWDGTLRNGCGDMVAAGFEFPYAYTSRFGEGEGSNPEELIAAAHAGCFSMAFAEQLELAGFTPVSVQTEAAVHIDKQEQGHAITRIDLRTVADVPGIDDAAFQRIAQTAKTGCPVSRALAAVPEITLDARMASSGEAKAA